MSRREYWGGGMLALGDLGAGSVFSFLPEFQSHARFLGTEGSPGSRSAALPCLSAFLAFQLLFA